MSRSKLTDADFRKAARDSIAQFVDKDDQDEKVIERFVSVCSYVSNDVSDEKHWADLSKNLRDDPKIVRAFYLAVAPDGLSVAGGAPAFSDLDRFRVDRRRAG